MQATTGVSDFCENTVVLGFQVYLAWVKACKMAPCHFPGMQADSDLARLEQRMLSAISTTPTEDLLEETEVYRMLVELQEQGDALKDKMGRIGRNQKVIAQVRSDMDKVSGTA